MDHIGSNFERYRTLTAPDEIVRRAVKNAVKETTGIVLSMDAIRFRNSVAYLSLSPAAKTSMAIHRAEILASIETILGKSHVRDVR